jgi:oxygen-independent coproporphyrinogen-3 oxidase
MSEATFLKSNETTASAAIYVHWPFCLKKCPYCDFNSHVRETVNHKNWQAALVQEITHFADRFPNLKTKSIFFGGGTPSLMEAETVELVIDTIKKRWPQSSDNIEITLEANPSSIEAGRFKEYRAAGVNRISVGIQSLRDDALKFLGRLHSAEEAINALHIARETFDRVSFDLIYARPEQTAAAWEKELSEALAFEPSHLSLYQLTIEEGTAFYHQFHRGKFILPGEDEAARLYTLTQDMTRRADLPAYEVSNHAKSGQESKHNLCYWQGDYYLGIGPGAHGRLPGEAPYTAVAHNQIKRPEDWLKAIDNRKTGLEDIDHINAEDRAIEMIMMGLRLNTGIKKDSFTYKTGKNIEHFMDKISLQELTNEKFIENSQTYFKVTTKGLPLLNTILAKLLA